MPKKKIVSPVPADLHPAVDALIRRAIAGLTAHIEVPISVQAELHEALFKYLRPALHTKPVDVAHELRALAKRLRPLPDEARVPVLVEYQLSQRLYRFVSPTSGKWLKVPDLLGFADFAVKVIVPGDFSVTTAAPRNFGHQRRKGLPISDSQPGNELEPVYRPVNQWWRYVISPRGSGIASTFQRLQHLRAWAMESDIVVEDGEHYLPNLRPCHFGVISDDEELCGLAEEQGFRTFLVAS